MVTRDLLGTNLLITSEQGKAFNLDTILLADFVRIPKGSELVCDFGTGNGSILLYLSQKFHKKLLGVEIQKHRYEQAIENINMNELDKQIQVLNQDIKATKLKKEADVIVSNPPFFKVNEESRKSMDHDMQIAKHETLLTLEELIASVFLNLKHGGLFFMIHKPDRLEEIMLLLNQYDFKVKRIRMVHPYLDSEPNHVLIEARKKGSAHLKVLPPLILYHEKHVYSEELNAIYNGRAYQNESSK